MLEIRKCKHDLINLFCFNHGVHIYSFIGDGIHSFVKFVFSVSVKKWVKHSLSCVLQFHRVKIKPRVDSYTEIRKCLNACKIDWYFFWNRYLVICHYGSILWVYKPSTKEVFIEFVYFKAKNIRKMSKLKFQTHLPNWQMKAKSMLAPWSPTL